MTLEERTRAVGMCPPVLGTLSQDACTKALGNCIVVPTMVLVMLPIIRCWLEKRRHADDDDE